MICAIGVLAVAVFIGVFVEAPWWMDAGRLHALGALDVAAQHNALDEDRSQILKIVAGLGASIALIYTARKHVLERNAHALNEQSHITDRYIKAVEQLGSSSVDVRLGGIYGLGRTMRDSATDRVMVVDVLAAYLRHHSSTPAEPANGMGVDIGAALNVLAHGAGTDNTDLRDTKLCGIEVVAGQGLAGANIARSDLREVNWVNLSLAGTNLFRVNLSQAGILGSDLSGASLDEADLTEALLHGSTFAGARFQGANLSGANLLNTDLSAAKELTAEQLSVAGISATTLLPPALRDDPWIRARLADCADWAARWDWDSLPAPPPPTPIPTAAR